jgi:CheY-like chemotaxis protein
MIKNVLVVDDDLANRKLPALILDSSKYLVFESCDGEQALDMLARIDIHFILLDISLPHVNGIDLCKQIRSISNFSHIKIFAYTAHAMHAQTNNILAAGFDDLLIKPINRRDLLNLFGEA